MLIPTRCIMCKMDEEIANHLLVQCSVAGLVQYFFALFGKRWVLQGDLQSVIQDWCQFPIGFLSYRGKLLWRAVPIVVCWSIRKEHNTRIFEGKIMDTPKLLDSASSLLFSLVSHLPLFLDVSYTNWTFSWDSLILP